jgi:hypothetical protein
MDWSIISKSPRDIEDVPACGSKKNLRDDSLHLTLFALADKKRTFISDLKNLTFEEIQGWIAFYEIQAEEMKKSHA